MYRYDGKEHGDRIKGKSVQVKGRGIWDRVTGYRLMVTNNPNHEQRYLPLSTTAGHSLSVCTV